MDLRTMKNFELWLYDPYFDEKTREELKSLDGDMKEIEDRFYKDLEFGTAGLRGIIGAGTNRMNIYTVRKATQGLANHIKSKGYEAMKKGVVIAHDSRHMSKEFTLEAALVLACNEIKAYVFEDLRPTPELSFAVRHLNAVAGIVITASHNPPEYNGYKAYWEDGAQIATEKAEDIIREINEINDFYSIHTMDQKEALRAGLLVYIGEETDEAYLRAVKEQSLRQGIAKEAGADFKIVFTPLHGTGGIPIRRVLKDTGFEHVLVVPEQELPDPDFPTVSYPNPEEKAAFTIAVELAEKENADIIIGTDPDCDRVGVAVKNKGEYVLLTGNQTGALLVEYILSTLKEQKRLPDNGIVIKTIVTGEMGAAIAEHYGTEIFNVLTGFKYIGEKIKEYEKTKEKIFLFGYEESNGYLSGTYARDKDAVVASMLICEMAAYYHTKGLNLYEALFSLYEKYGYFADGVKSIAMKGKEGMGKIARIMENIRRNPPDEIEGIKAARLEDYLNQNRLPKSDVIKLIFEDQSWLCLRPSGTEPKLKIYAGAKGKTLEESRKKMNLLLNAMQNQIQQIK